MLHTAMREGKVSPHWTSRLRGNQGLSTLGEEVTQFHIKPPYIDLSNSPLETNEGLRYVGIVRFVREGKTQEMAKSKRSLRKLRKNICRVVA